VDDKNKSPEQPMVDIGRVEFRASEKISNADYQLGDSFKNEETTLSGTVFKLALPEVVPHGLVRLRSAEKMEIGSWKASPVLLAPKSGWAFRNLLSGEIEFFPQISRNFREWGMRFHIAISYKKAACIS